MTIAVMMGVSGSGKTTIARGVAQREGWRLVEGDDSIRRRMSRRCTPARR